MSTDFGRPADEQGVQSFRAKIGTTQDADADFEAVLKIGAGTLEITAGDQQIGAWPVTDVELDLTNRGYRMSVEGEHLLVSPVDRFTFRDALEAEIDSLPSGKRRRFRRARAKAQAAREKGPSRSEIRKAAQLEKARQEEAARRAKLAARERAKEDAKAAKLAAKEERKERGGLFRSRPTTGLDTKLDPSTKPVERAPEPWEVPVQDEAPPVVERTRLTDSLPDIPLPWRIGIGGGVVAMAAGIFFPRIIATLLLLPGLLAVMTAGLGLVDPGYTRKLPPALTEHRLLTIGGVLVALGLVIVTIF